MKKLNVYFALFLLVFAVSCGEKTTENTENEEVISEPACSYSLLTDSLKIGWTAYKYTEKAGVNGVFDSLSTTSAVASADSAHLLLPGLEITVRTGGINSNSEIRDGKIKAIFFGALVGDEIKGQIKSAGDGQMLISLTINEVTKEISMEYVVSETEITAKGEFNLNDFGAETALKAMNEACEDLHKGEDGLSILYPDMSFSVSVPLQKNCE